jgi:hypothetical protein
MRFKFKLLLSTLVFLSACQTRLSFEGRRYTKGLYWNITSSPHTKKQKSNIQNTIVAPAKFKPLEPHLSIKTSNEHESTLKQLEAFVENLHQNKISFKPKIILNNDILKTSITKQNTITANVKVNEKIKTNDNSLWTALMLLMLVLFYLCIGIIGFIILMIIYDRITDYLPRGLIYDVIAAIIFLPIIFYIKLWKKINQKIKTLNKNSGTKTNTEKVKPKFLYLKMLIIFIALLALTAVILAEPWDIIADGLYGFATFLAGILILLICILLIKNKKFKSSTPDLKINAET